MNSRQKKKILKKVSLHKRLTWREILYAKNYIYQSLMETVPGGYYLLNNKQAMKQAEIVLKEVLEFNWEPIDINIEVAPVRKRSLGLLHTHF